MMTLHSGTYMLSGENVKYDIRGFRSARKRLTYLMNFVVY